MKAKPDVRAVTTADLITLEPLLRASYGRDDFELEDEEAFAASSPRDWFVLFDGSPQGFIRYFPLDDNLYIGELYVVPGSGRAGRLEHLLRHFAQHHKLPATATLRLDVPQTDAELTGVLKSLFPTARTKTFACYRLRTSSQQVATSVEQITEDDLRAVRAILAPLKRYSLEELERLSPRRSSSTSHKHNGVKAALCTRHRHGHGRGSRSSPWQPRQLTFGADYASALLQTVSGSANPKTDVTLKVNIENTAAVSLYGRTGLCPRQVRPNRSMVVSSAILNLPAIRSRHPYTSSTRDIYDDADVWLEALPETLDAARDPLANPRHRALSRSFRGTSSLTPNVPTEHPRILKLSPPNDEKSPRGRSSKSSTVGTASVQAAWGATTT